MRRIKGAPTRTNLYVLRSLLDAEEKIPARIAASDYPHIKRCLDAGLLTPDGAVVRLTESGRAALKP